MSFPDSGTYVVPRRARSGRDRPRARRGRLRRAERLDAPPHLGRQAHELAGLLDQAVAHERLDGFAVERRHRLRLRRDERAAAPPAAAGTSPRSGTACAAARSGVRATGSARRADRRRSAARARGRPSRRGRRAPAARPGRTRARCAPGSGRRWCRPAGRPRRRPGCGSRRRCTARRPGARSGRPASPSSATTCAARCRLSARRL